MPSPSNATRPGAQASQAASAKFESFKWMRGVADDQRITQFRRFILIRLCLFRNPKNGRCDPSYDTVAEILNVDRATVIRAAEDGVRYGWLAPPKHRRRRTNLFAFTFPIGWQPPRKESQPCDSKDGSQPCDPNGIRSGRNATHSLPLGRESEPSVRDPGSARTALEGAAAEPSRPESHVEADPGGTSPKGWRRADDQAATRTKVSITAVMETLAQPEDGGAHAAWAELRGLWRRGHLADDTPKAIAITRAAFVKVIAQGTPPEEIVAAAKQWVAAFAAADGLAYLPQLATWLSSRGFERLPPAKRKRRSNKSRDHLPRQNGKVDLTTLTLMRAGYIEDENGNLFHPDGDAGTAFWWRASS
jgi:hypothetical protein